MKLAGRNWHLSLFDVFEERQRGGTVMQRGLVWRLSSCSDPSREVRCRKRWLSASRSSPAFKSAAFVEPSDPPLFPYNFPFDAEKTLARTRPSSCSPGPPPSPEAAREKCAQTPRLHITITQHHSQRPPEHRKASAKGRGGVGDSASKSGHRRAQ